jgi:hypothetical protein
VSTLKQIAVGLGVVVIVCLGMAWYTMHDEIRGAANAEAAARGWRPVFAEAEQPEELQWSYAAEPDMAKCPVTSGSYGGSIEINIAIGKTSLGYVVYPVTTVLVSGGGGYCLIEYMGSTETHIQYQCYLYQGASPATGAIGTASLPIPAANGSTAVTSFAWTWEMSNAALDVSVAEEPIGAKGPTHAKEIRTEELWAVPEDAHVVMSLSGGGLSLDYDELAISVDMTTGVSIYTHDIDFWDNLGDMVEFAQVAFSGNNIDTSGYTKRLIGTHDNAWVEGTGDGFRFWCEPGVLLGPDSGWGESANAPFVHNWADMEFKWLDGSDIDDSLEVYCTSLRNLSVGGVDIGPKKLTIAELRSTTWTQQHGCYSWDDWEPDMQADMQIYLSLASAEALGIPVRPPRPDFRVENCGFGGSVVDEVWVPGPFDGAYWWAGMSNGLPAYTNGYGWLFCIDASGPDWGLGPAMTVAPYYVQWMGGPGGIYLVNTDVYNDSVIDDETGQRQFSGLPGMTTVATADTSDVIYLDSHLATPAWNHAGTVCFGAWPLSATNRTDAPWMTDVCSLGFDAAKGIYGSAHTHEDWVGTNCSTPTSGGVMTVGAGGGSILLTLACNYGPRQAAVGDIDAIPVPTAYLVRRHNQLLGSGNPVEGPEAVWDWRGYYLLLTLTGLSLPCDITCRIRYYDDLNGCSDPHVTGMRRQTEYSYDPGELYTLERTIHVTYADVDDVSDIVIDLYDEVNEHPLARVVDIEIEMPAGTYTLSEPMLIPDQGDRQQITSVDPYYREAPLRLSGLLKIDESPSYAQGLASMVINGYCDAVMCVPDMAKPAVVERTMDTLAVLYGAKSGQDMTTNYSLGAWPVQNGGERIGYTHSQGNEDAHMVDADGERLAVLAVRDIRPEWALEEDAGIITPAVAVRCYSITTVRGLQYNFSGRYIAGGRGNGMTVRTGHTDYPRARNGRAGSLWQRPMGSTSATAWQIVEDDIEADEHGRWASSAWEVSSDNAARTLWEYAIKSRGIYHSLGRFATREYALAESELDAGAQPHLRKDPAGRLWLTYNAQGDICVAVRCSPIRELEARTNAFSAGDHCHPCVVPMPDGSIIVCATRVSTLEHEMVVSRDDGESWTAV